MSKGYKLRDDGVIGFKKIMRGKEWIGRVTRHLDGSYLGVIGNAMIKAATEKEAFDSIIARQLGFQNSNQMRAHGVTPSQYEFRKGKKSKGHKAKHWCKLGGIQVPEQDVKVEVVTGLPQMKRVNPYDEER